MGKKKPGPKKKAGVTYTPSGQKSRAQSAYAEHLPGIERRMMRFGLSEENARDQKAGSVVGRLRLTKVITEPQYDAALIFVGQYEAFKRAVSSPGAAKTGGGEIGEPSEGYAEWCAKAVETYNAAEDVLRAAGNRHRRANIYAAVDYLLLRDQDFVHMREDLKLGLLALAVHYGLIRDLTDSGSIAA